MMGNECQTNGEFEFRVKQQAASACYLVHKNKNQLTIKTNWSNLVHDTVIQQYIANCMQSSNNRFTEPYYCWNIDKQNFKRFVHGEAAST